MAGHVDSFCSRVSTCPGETPCLFSLSSCFVLPVCMPAAVRAGCGAGGGERGTRVAGNCSANEGQARVCILPLLLITTDPAIALPLLPLPEFSVPAHWGVRLVVARGAGYVFAVCMYRYPLWVE